MDRSARLASLRRIIETNKVASQDMLLKLLQDEGYIVTQATLSRDLKHLKVGKIPDGKGGYLYTYSDSANKGGSDKSLAEDFKRGYIGIDFSGNMAVVKTLPRHASTVAFAIDNLHIKEIVGTVAGDDTILILPKDGVKRQELIHSLKSRIPGFTENL